MVLRRKEAETLNGPRRFKARLCGKGFLHQFGIDYNESYAPVAAYNAVRVFVALMASLDYELYCVDITICQETG
jgi:Reverse transcriptase (RNA-dependent DNA polymerase)